MYKKSKDDRAFIDEWAKKQIDNTIVITKDKEFKLSDVKTLSIENGVVKVHTKEGIFELYSKTWDDAKIFELKDINSLSRIVLDHTESIRAILDKNYNELPVLCEMTKRIYSKNKNITNGKKYLQTVSGLLKEGKFDNVDIPELKKELDLLGCQIRLQLMERKENRKKSDK